MNNSFSEYFFSLKDGKLSLTVWGVLVVLVIAWLAVVLLAATLKYLKFRKKERAYFEKYFKRIERDESLDRSIDILKKSGEERVFIKIGEKNPNSSRDYTFELNDAVLGGSDFSKCGVFINDEAVDPVHFSLALTNSKLELEVLSEDKNIEVYKTNFFGINKIYDLKRGEKFTLKSGDTVRVGGTTLNISVFSNINGVI